MSLCLSTARVFPLSYRHMFVHSHFSTKALASKLDSRMALIRNPEVVKPLHSTSPIRWRSGLLSQEYSRKFRSGMTVAALKGEQYRILFNTSDSRLQTA